MNSSRLSKRIWLSLIIFSFFGQVAWIVENMYFNVFIFQEFNASSNNIALMVTLSALTATLTTLFIGALSDKIGKRKLFICFGYILWGISIISFALLKQDILKNMFGVVNAASLGIVLVILFDCIMTFFGSSANDASFNAWLTDVTNPNNRGKVEGVNASMPLIALLVVFGAFMGLTAKKEWSLIFIIIGSTVLFAGILGFFLIKDQPIEKKQTNYFQNIFYGFRLKVIKSHSVLYIILLGLAVFGIAVQVFMPYLILYYQYRLQLDNYVFIFAPAIILASIATIIFGRLLDKFKFKKAIIPVVIIFVFGLLILYFSSNIIMVFIGTLLMMIGNLTIAAAFGAIIRDYTPKDQVGLFQGLRIFAMVLIPMAIGPWIGSSVINSSEAVLGDDGIINKIPTSSIFLASFFVVIILLIVIFFILRKIKTKKVDLLTDYEKQLDKKYPWFEYPRPQLKRDSYFNLNGVWKYKITKENNFPQNYDGEIIVPFPLESTLSGVKKKLHKGEYLFYQREFSLPKNFLKDILMINFGAVDQIAYVYINKKLAVTNYYGYLPFSADISKLVKEGINEIIVKVQDNLDTKYPYGKQSHKNGGIWYTPVTGIWQSVWMESVSKDYIESIKITPDIDKNEVNIKVNTTALNKDIKVIFKDTVVIKKSFKDKEITLKMDNPKLWSPEEPNLYTIELSTSTDKISSYFAMRKFYIGEHNGYKHFFLNNKPYFCNGLLDQGYFSDGLYLPATINAYIDDIKLMKELGFNTLRKHIKIEPLLWYYLCDTIGMIVWQDMVNNSRYSFFRDSLLPFIGIKKVADIKRTIPKVNKNIFLESSIKTINLLYNIPSIVLWTIFNEGWGQFSADEVYEKLKSNDSTRIFDSTSGWFKQKLSDVESLHIYFKKIEIPKSEKPIIISEFGGYSYKVKDHSYNLDENFGYKFFEKQTDYNKGLIDLYEKQIIPNLTKGLASCIYTQLSDVEEETNGLLTYDRKICKVDKKMIQEMNKKVKL